MGRRRRRIRSQKCYEVCFRAKEGLPLVAYHVINMIIGSVIARAQRDHKVTLCHDLWNGSHAHLFLVARDAEKFFQFLAEVQKQLTEGIKRLLGQERLSIWEGTPMVAEVLDATEAINRISYIYANPSQDGLVDVIDKFPGFSSWQDFRSAGDTLYAMQSKSYPWIRQPTIPRLDSTTLSQEEDHSLVRIIKKLNKESHELVRCPNLWMKSFGISDDLSVAEINQEILSQIQKREEAARQKRKVEGRSVMGVARLTSQAIMKSHKPQKRERKIFCLSSTKELRIAFIEEFKRFCRQCRECYERMRAGDFLVEWPPGAFKPPIRPAYNILSPPPAGHLSFL